MAEVQRRTTSGGELGTRERRKSGIFFFNRSFKNSRSASYNKGESESLSSTPITPTLSHAKDIELKRTVSGHSIPIIAQTSTITAEAEGVLSSSPKSASISLGEATQKPAVQNSDEISSEELPTPPQTPGHSSQEAGADETTTEITEPEETEATEATEEAEEVTTLPSEPLQVVEEAPQEPELPAVKTVSYHEDADLGVKVRETDGTEAVYSVCSSILQHATPVFKQTIPSETSTLDLTSDPAPGLDVIFSIAHYKFQDVPQQVDESQIHDIALVAEKYSALHLLFPFLKGWLATAPSPTGDSDKSIVTGWILGQTEWFSKAVSQSANSASVSTDGTLLDAQGRPWSEQPVSSEVVELIASTRASVIERIIQAVSSPMTKLLNPEDYPEEDIRYCHAAEEDAAVREECEQLQLGSAIMGLTKARLWPAPEVSRIRASPVDLARTYKEIRMRRFQTPGLRFQEEEVKDAHAGCGFGHHVEIESILSGAVSLTPGITEHLQSRAKKCGLSDGVVSEDYFTTQISEVPAVPVSEESAHDGLVDGPSTETIVPAEADKADS